MESRYLFGEGKTGRGEIPLPASSSLETRRSRKPRVAFLCCFLGLLAWIRLCQRHQPPDSWAVTQQSRNPAYLIEAEHGAVASENKRCSDMGVEVLKDGGNAIDAAVSVTFCVGVVNMFSSGIGGGGFMTVRIPSKDANSSSEVFDIDFREVAPALSNSSMFSGGSNSSMFGGLSVAVPGELRGLEEAHKRWGTVPWKRLVQPSVDLAAGWQVDKELGRRIPWFVDLMLGNPDWRDIFAPNGVLLKEGEMIRRTNYSRTLATIATGGADAFYKGPIADALVQKITMTGGILSHADLEGYKVKVSRALQGTYRDRKIHTTHAPTSGPGEGETIPSLAGHLTRSPVLLHMLNLMEKYDLETRDGVNTHRSVEAMKFGFSARTRICDPGFQNITDIINSISTKTFANIIFPNITDGHTHPPDYYNPKYDVLTDHGTSHTSIVDKNGMAVSLTSTINLVFGSEVLDPVTGVILNDEMDDFSVPGTPNGFGLWPSPYNYPEPGKRPLSSTTPTIIENADGSFYLSIGGSGGSRIFPAVFQVILNLEWGLDLSSAIEFGRLHNQLYPLFLDADNVYPSDILDDLRRRGHNVIVADVNRVASAVNGVMIKDGKIFAASDSRKNGIAAGY